MARRYHAIGGVTAWRAPLGFGVLAAVIAVHGEADTAWIVAAAGFVVYQFDRSLVFDVALPALSAGRSVGAALVAPRTVAWPAVEEITTRWRGPRDFSALDTAVLARDGTVLRFGSRMGLRAYRALLADVVRHAPAARRTGLTDEVLADAA